MKTILMTMTALAAVAVAAPAAAQPWNGQQNRTADLQTQLDAGISSGQISRREAMPLQSSLRDLLSLERQFSANGFTGRENAALRQRSATLANQIRTAERTGYGNARGTNPDYRDGDRYDRSGQRAGWDNRSDRQDSMADARFDAPNRGDRFNGDVRVGQPATTVRMAALPEAYRDDFRDTDDVYYRYDAGRIFRIDRRTNVVLGLTDTDGRGRWDNRSDRQDSMADARFDAPNRGDRFAGDVRVGQPATTVRMAALPEAYRNDFRDTDDVYYRYDAGRIFRIDRRTDVVLGLTDTDARGRWDNRSDRQDSMVDTRFDRPNRGDRFAGDPRVGQEVTRRMGALPEAYRGQFRDTAEVYYRHDAGRIYRVNRRTGMILGLFDI